MNTDTGRVAEWRRREPVKYKLQKNREVVRRRLRRAALKEYAAATKEATK